MIFLYPHVCIYKHDLCGKSNNLKDKREGNLKVDWILLDSSKIRFIKITKI